MQLSPCQAILVIADISGFTKFMKLHAITTSHAKQIIVALLESLVNASAPPLELAELEGDAAFFYAACREQNGDLRQTIERVRTQVIDLFKAFYQKLYELDGMRVCICEACVGIDNLRLKVVMHAGEVEFEQIRSFVKLFGLDVIVVHRLLKNSVRSKEYVMMTDSLYRQFGDFYALKPEKRREEFEGIGKLETVVFYPPEELIGVAGIRAKLAPPSFSRKLANWLRMDFDTVMDLAGLRRLGDKFQNLPVKGN
jgi:hypothetical protein